MINNLRSIFSQFFYAPAVSSSTSIQKSEYNPYENPFIQPAKQSSTYGVNKPVKGGYFAGYYNGKPNIVGRRLFIEA